MNAWDNYFFSNLNHKNYSDIMYSHFDCILKKTYSKI